MKERFTKIAFLILVIICAISIVFSVLSPKIFEPLKNVMGYILVPLQNGVNKIGTKIINDATEEKTIDSANKKIEELQKEIDELIEKNNILKAETYEIDRLRQLLELSEDYGNYNKVAARVISKDSDEWFQVFRIDKGSKDGIKVDMNVLSGAGLCGIVTSVGENYATVRAIIDDESRVSAMTQHSGEKCIVEGDITLYNNQRLKLADINIGSTIVDGDKIVTSNISSKFLPGILIGYAADVSVEDSNLKKSGYLIPVVDFEDLFEVLVITDLKSEYDGGAN